MRQKRKTQNKKPFPPFLTDSRDHSPIPGHVKQFAAHVTYAVAQCHVRGHLLFPLREMWFPCCARAHSKDTFQTLLIVPKYEISSLLSNDVLSC